MDFTNMDLDELRREIDKNDNELLKLFIKRMELVNAVAEYKIKNNIATLDASREQKILNRVAADSGEFAPFSVELFKNMMKLSRDYQDKRRSVK